MQNKKLVILIALSIIAVFALVYGIFTPSKRKGGPANKTSETVEVGTSQLKERIIPDKRGIKRSSQTSLGRNPFIPKTILQAISSEVSQAPKQKPVPVLRLDAIIGSSRAVINGTLVEIGYSIGGIELVDIKKDRVILKDGGRIFELLLGQ